MRWYVMIGSRLKYVGLRKGWYATGAAVEAPCPPLLRAVIESPTAAIVLRAIGNGHVLPPKMEAIASVLALTWASTAF